MLDYPTVKAMLAGERLPAVFVDLDALDANLNCVLAAIGGHDLPLRIASKSLRVVAILQRLMERGGGRLRGLLCYSVEEAEFLAERGFDDLLVAYPPYQRSDVERLAKLTHDGRSVSAVIDSEQGAARFSQIGKEHGTRIRTVLCVDMSLKALGGRAHLGVRRSPLHAVRDVVALARRVAEAPGTTFHGLMGYEAQVAGLADDGPYARHLNPIKKLVRRLSVRELGPRRAEMVAALRAAGLEPTVVNGGGSGSLDTTTPATGVTEVTAGSAFYKPHLFDHFSNAHLRALRPACFFALEVTRRPAPGFVTCLGGGYVASGPPGPDKHPLPWLPRGLSLLPAEMAGEVQTPLAGPAAAQLDLGDPIVFRHAKGGEPMERFCEVLLVRDGRIVDRAATYRGEGRCFF